MKLLIITQKADKNDPILGFFHRWIEEFAAHCEHVTVICLYEGVHHFPGNVRVFSLGKETLPLKISYVLRFFRSIIGERKNYDAVFVHMNPIYVILGGLLWKIMGKKISLWYTHKNVDYRLRVAEFLSDVIFTASRKSFRLESRKLVITGHGIDTNLFIPVRRADEGAAITVLSAGRLSPVKKHETSIMMTEALKRRGKRAKLVIIGAPASAEDEKYLLRLQQYVEKHNLADDVDFIGSVPNREMVRYFQNADILVNASETGSLDKVVLEAMSTGVVPVTSNEAFFDILDPFGLAVKTGSADEMARIAEAVVNAKDREVLSEQLRKIVMQDHAIGALIAKIVERIKNQP